MDAVLKQLFRADYLTLWDALCIIVGIALDQGLPDDVCGSSA